MFKFLTPILIGLSFPAPSVEAVRFPNVLLIMSDSQRTDTVGALGNPIIKTPNLDSLVEAGTTFTRAIVANPQCVPSRAELITGATGFLNQSPPFGRRINPEFTPLAETLQKAGYHTWYAGMGDSNPQARGYEEAGSLFTGGGARGLPPSFPHSHSGRPISGFRGYTFKAADGTAELEKGIGLTPETDVWIADAAIDFINRRPERPFFLHVNFPAAHDPLIIPQKFAGMYDAGQIPLPPNFLPEHPFDHGNFSGRDEQLLDWPRTPEAVKREIAAYYAVISHLDDQVGRILQALQQNGQSENTLIIFTTDHGLALGSHGLMGKQNMYEHTLGVPLIMAGPGLPRNQLLPAQTYLRDIYPTLCDLIGIPKPPTVEGRSLIPVLTGQVTEIYPELFAYWHRAGMEAPFPISRMVRTNRWKLIYYSHLDRYQLFDLAADPHEQTDLSGNVRHRSKLAELKNKMESWFAPRIATWQEAMP